MKTEIQSLFARRKAGTATDIEFIWKTMKIVRTTYEAKRDRNVDQRIVRASSPKSKHPAHVVSYDGRKLHVFNNAITPVETLKAQALSRSGLR